MRTAARWIEAKYSGRCNCGERFARSAVIRYDGSRRPHERITACPKCAPQESAQGPSDRGPDAVDMAYEDDCARRTGLDSLNPFGRD